MAIATSSVLIEYLGKSRSPLAALAGSGTEDRERPVGKLLEEPRIMSFGLNCGSNRIPGLTIDALQIASKLREIATYECQLDRLKEGFELLISGLAGLFHQVLCMRQFLLWTSQ